MKRIIFSSVALLIGAVAFAQTAPVEKKEIKKQDMKQVNHNAKKTKVDRKDLQKDKSTVVIEKKELKSDKAEVKTDAKQTKPESTHQPIQRVTPPAKN